MVDNKAPQDNVLVATPPALSPPSATSGHDLKWNEKGRVFTKKKEVVYWMAQLTVVYYPFLRLEGLTDQGDSHQ